MSAFVKSFSNTWTRFFKKTISLRISSLFSVEFGPVDAFPAGFIASIASFNLRFSSLYVWSCRFHSSTFAVDSCSALVKRMLLLFNVASSISHFLALVQLVWGKTEKILLKPQLWLRKLWNPPTFGLMPSLVVHFHILIVARFAVRTRWMNCSKKVYFLNYSHS